MITAVLNSIFW